jgi:hypothetical protein
MAKKILYLLIPLLIGLKLSAQTVLPDSVPTFDVQSQEKQDTTSLKPNFTRKIYGALKAIATAGYYPETKKLHEESDSMSLSENIYFGFGVGPETGMSLFLPKLSYYKFQSRKNFETYYGIEGTIGMTLHSPYISFDALFGVKKNVFTFDNSIAVLYFPRYNDTTDTFDYYHHATFNPKIGIKFWKVWLKAGPSLFLYRDYPKETGHFGNFVKIGNIYYNFEVLIYPN